MPDAIDFIIKDMIKSTKMFPLFRMILVVKPETKPVSENFKTHVNGYQEPQ